MYIDGVGGFGNILFPWTYLQSVFENGRGNWSFLTPKLLGGPISPNVVMDIMSEALVSLTLERC
jgi:hypothetical protein